MGRLTYINRFKTYFDKTTRHIIVDALVLSQINYCIKIWGSTNKTVIQKIQKLQNFAAKVVDETAKKFDHVTPIITELKWLKLDKQYAYEMCCLVFKILTSMLPDWFFSFSKVHEITESRTRQANNLFIPRTNLDIGKRAISVQGPILWNELPESVKNSNSLPTFKTKLKNHLLTNSQL